MKLNIREDKSVKESIIDITYNIFDRRIKKIIDIIETPTLELQGEINGRFSLIDVQDICYIESVDNITFLYTESAVYENKEKLYALENQLSQYSLIRINKSTILNMDYLQSVSPLPNYRLEAHLPTGETLIINRGYMQAVKDYLNL